MQPIQRQHIRKGAQYSICKAFNKTCLAIRIYADYYNNPTERRQGLKAGGNILNACDTIIIGARYGVSAGMAAEMDAAKEKYTIIVI